MVYETQKQIDLNTTKGKFLSELPFLRMKKLYLSFTLFLTK